jgi:hypothetical protein
MTIQQIDLAILELPPPLISQRQKSPQKARTDKL